MPNAIADLHIHSPFSRAVSPEMTVPNLAVWGKKKGITLIGTGDFTHPKWLGELKKMLTQDGSGLAQYANVPDVKFILTAEIACMYRKNDRTRRLHVMLLAPSIEAVEKLNTALTGRGCKLGSDGRPIIGMDVVELYRIALDISPDFFMIPAHIWTPWFGLFGSKSGFDSLAECFGDLASQVTAVETGLSSDPPMNWRIAELDSRQIVSFSDAHSLPNLGREATVFDLPGLTYRNLIGALRGDSALGQIVETIEFYPEEGRYHWDGHAACNVSLPPEETKKLKGLCSVCHRPLTIGVMSRVNELAARPIDYRSKSRTPYRSLVPLQEVIAEAYDVGKQSKQVQTTYEEIIATVGSEFAVLLDIPLDQLADKIEASVVEGIRRIRTGQLDIRPGYDGAYGVVKIFKAGERPALRQKSFL